MVEKLKKHKKGLITEDDIATLLQRYTATTVLSLLQEVAQFPGVKLDWDALVQKSSTGISNAREYQMLWRHLAYRGALLENLEDGFEPMDDDSDIEYEVEAFPDVSSEASAEAAACVKVLIASGLPSDSSLPNNSMVEAPLTINIPNGLSYRTSSDSSQLLCSKQGVNITVPVSVQKQSFPTVSSTEGLDSNGLASGGIPKKKKRKLWSEAEDLELIAAVQRCGEGNWANILRGDFKGDRTASQLSQRWSIIRKKHSHLNIGANSNSTKLSEALLAARNAVALALDRPSRNLSAASTNNPGCITMNNTSSNPVTSGAETSLTGSSSAQVQQQPRQSPNLMISAPVGPLGSNAKSRLSSKKPSAKSNFSSDSMVRAAAVAAGARIATPSDAASLLKAAQAKNAIHIMATGGSSLKSSMTGSAASHLEGHPNVHYISTGLTVAPHSTYSAVTSGALRPGPVKGAATVVHTPSTSASSSNMSSEQTNAVTSSLAPELPAKLEAETVEDGKVSESVNGPSGLIQEGRACVSGKELREEVRVQNLSFPEGPKPEADLTNQGNVGMGGSGNSEATCNQSETSQAAKGSMMIVEGAVKDGENLCAVEENYGNLSESDKPDKPAESSCVAVDEGSRVAEVVAKTEADTEI